MECEVCGSTELEDLLNLGTHALCDDLIPVGSNLENTKYPIEIAFCNICKTAHQKYQVPQNLLFPDSYHYRAAVTASVQTGMIDLVKEVETRFGSLNGKTILDVGCNDGSLLNYFKEKGCITLGVEPTNAASSSKHHTYNCFFNVSTAKKILEDHGTVDIITFTNVFAHIEDLQSLLEAVAILAGPDTKLVIENHYLGAVIKFGQFDTFYHEHPRTYSATSFLYIAKALNARLADVSFVSRYGGNIRAFIDFSDNFSDESADLIPSKEESFRGGMEFLQAHMTEWIFKTKEKLRRMAIDGPLKAKAFPGRAAILIELLELDTGVLEAVYEIEGSIKVGCYLPGTRIPILPEKDLFSLKNQPSRIINLAWHIPNDVAENVKSHGFQGEIINIKNFEEVWG